MNSEELLERLVDWGARCIRVGTALPRSDIGRHVCLQLTRAATSAGANYSEACGAQSKRDFVHKMHLVVKELRETDYWLRLIQRSGLVPQTRLCKIREGTDELLAICVASAKTAKKSSSA